MNQTIIYDCFSNARIPNTHATLQIRASVVCDNDMSARTGDYNFANVKTSLQNAPFTIDNLSISINGNPEINIVPMNQVASWGSGCAENQCNSEGKLSGFDGYIIYSLVFQNFAGTSSSTGTIMFSNSVMKYDNEKSYSARVPYGVNRIIGGINNGFEYWSFRNQYNQQAIQERFGYLWNYTLPYFTK